MLLGQARSLQANTVAQSAPVSKVPLKTSQARHPSFATTFARVRGTLTPEKVPLFASLVEPAAAAASGAGPSPCRSQTQRVPHAKEDEPLDERAAAHHGEAAPGMFELDPLGRALAQQALALKAAEVQVPAPVAAPSPPLDRLVERLLRRFALSATKGRGVAHLELGDAALGGGRLTIEAEGRAVRIVVEQDGGCDQATERWAKQLEQRLQAKGLTTEVELR